MHWHTSNISYVTVEHKNRLYGNSNYSILKLSPMGFTPLMVSIFFLASALMFGLGVIGEYLKRIYNSQNSKPAYSIDTLRID